jgi:hypothetical protein
VIDFIIGILKRIFMNPETTNKVTEDTNVKDKAILSKAQLSTVESTGAYWLSYSSTESIKYQKADNNTYMVEGYFSQSFNGVPYLEVYPLNTMILRLDTYNMFSEGIATQQSFVDPSGNYLEIFFRWNYLGAAGVYQFFANRILYATRVTDEVIW